MTSSPTNSLEPDPNGGRGRAYVEGRHSVSEFNFRPDVVEGYEIPRPLGLIDSTIRKVVYTAGVRPSMKDFLLIGEILQEIGVKDESLNVGWWGETYPNEMEYSVLRTIAGAGFDFDIKVNTDTLAGDGRSPPKLMRQTVDLLAAAGVKSVNPSPLEAPTADAQQRQLDELRELGEYVASMGLSWTVTIPNCARRDFGKLVAVSNAAIEAGAQRMDLMDSTSALSPEAMKVFVRAYRSSLAKPVPMTMHTHDDFGMATAGTIAAVTAGASPDVALNGVSYRSGFAALEEVVLALDVLYGVDTGIRLDRLQWASDRLAAIMGFPVPPLKPVVGSHQFLRDRPHEITRLLRAGIDSFPPAGSCIAPDLIGSRIRWVWGTQSSDAMVQALAAHLGVTLNAEQIGVIRAELDARVDRIAHYPKWIEAPEAEAVIRRVAAEMGMHPAPTAMRTG